MAKKPVVDPNRIDKTHPDYAFVYNEWMKEDKPTRVRTKRGNYHAFKDNNDLFFVKEPDQNDNFSSFQKVF